MSVWEDLDDTLAGEEPDWSTEPVAALGAEDAGRKLRRLAAVNRDITAVRDAADMERKRIEEWEAGQLHALTLKHEWLTDSLAQYHRAVLARDPAAKTISLPWGKLTSRAQQPEWVFDDPEAFIAHCQTFEWAHLVRIPEPKPEIDKAAAKKVIELVETEDGLLAVLPDGDVPPGLTVTARDRKFVADPS